MHYNLLDNVKVRYNLKYVLVVSMKWKKVLNYVAQIFHQVVGTVQSATNFELIRLSLSWNIYFICYESDHGLCKSVI